MTQTADPTRTAASPGPVSPDRASRVPGRRGLSSDTTAALVALGAAAAFCGVIAATSSRLEKREIKQEDIYPWQSRKPTFWAMFTAWTFYLAHQLFQWGTIYYAQTRVKTYARGLHPINWIALGGNAFFVVLRYVQSHIWYDGLASHVSVWSSQSSVIAMLVMILQMENPRRGLVFGRRAPLQQDAVNYVRKYHGYYMSWATVYTFWYHPTLGNRGHLSGFFYMFTLMIQGSLFFTRVHLNRWWTLLMELLVLPHAVLVAVMNHPKNWPMFGFGFGAMFIITQLFGLVQNQAARWGILAVSAAGTMAYYRRRGMKYANEVVRIPLIELGLAWVFTWVIAGRLRIARPSDAPEPLPIDPLGKEVAA